MSLFGLAKAAATGSNPAVALLNLLWKPLLILALVAGAAGWIHHHGRVDGMADQEIADQSKIAKSNGERDAAVLRANQTAAANANLAQSEAALRAAAQTEQTERARLDQANADALKRAQAEASRAQANAEAWRKRSAPILGTDQCKAAKAELARACPLKDY